MRRVVLLSAAGAALAFTIAACGGGADDSQDGVRSAEAAPPESSVPVTPVVADTVPVTLTMPDNTHPNPVSKVRIKAVKDTIYTRPSSGTVQYLLGYVDVTDPIELKVEYWLGSATNPHPNPPSIFFAPQSQCEGDIERIACAVVTGGQANRLVCSATYDQMGNPPDTCTGTYACKRCPGGVTVCGENPQCVE